MAGTGIIDGYLLLISARLSCADPKAVTGHVSVTLKQRHVIVLIQQYLPRLLTAEPCTSNSSCTHEDETTMMEPQRWNHNDGTTMTEPQRWKHARL